MPASRSRKAISPPLGGAGPDAGALPGLRRHILIENPSPMVDGGRFPAKRVTGDDVTVEADILRDGHDVVRAVVRWRRRGAAAFSEAPMTFVDNDRWRGHFRVTENADHEFTVQAWTDRFSSWLADMRKRVPAGQDVASEAVEGAALIDEVTQVAADGDAALLTTAAAALRRNAKSPVAALDAVSDPAIERAMARLAARWDAVAYAPLLPLIVDRPRAAVGAWYEFFIRSQGTDKRRSGTFADAEKRLADIRQMGFDVLYLPPIHPIGRTARKGPNNSLKAGPNDPGSPWAIGNEQGGHTAVEPSLGTLDDFDRFVKKANAAGLEIALDFAIQCSPDHPWVKEHPEWFYRRPDGTIKYAENPPKKYEDIYPLNFDGPGAESLWTALRDVVLFWIGHGVKIFRVDNPHTKPAAFWEWMIGEVRRDHPEVVFLAEAFTRPKVMRALAKRGFSQSYTYFTWRNEKRELAEYLTELAESEMKEYYRPNFFANTPDILHEVLQTGGPGAFRLRAALAATLSPSWGIYSGFELCEHDPVPGTEEYMNSEKFEIKPRDWHAPGNIKDFIMRLNAARVENPALQSLSNVTFMDVTNDRMLGYMKMTEDRSNVVIAVVSLDPHNAQESWLRVPIDKLGFAPGARFEVNDLLSGQTFNWTENNWVRLSPDRPAHLLRLQRSPA